MIEIVRESFEWHHVFIGAINIAGYEFMLWVFRKAGL